MKILEYDKHASRFIPEFRVHYSLSYDMHCNNKLENGIKKPAAEKFAWYFPWRYISTILTNLTLIDLYRKMTYKYGEDWKVKLIITRFFSASM